MTPTSAAIATSPREMTTRAHGRSGLMVRPIRRRSERELLAQASDVLDFPVRVPTHVPWGMRLVKVVYVPGLHDFATLSFSDRHHFGFRFLQRAASDADPVAEVEISGSEHYFLDSEVRQYLVYTGKHLTEPIDGYYWAPTRRRVVWYEGDVRLELESLLTPRVSLSTLVQMADSSRIASPAEAWWRMPRHIHGGRHE